jgi:hypothetical protein
MSHFEKSIAQLNRKINAGMAKGAKTRRRLVYAGLLTAAFAAVAEPGYNFIQDEIARQQQLQEDRRAEAERQRQLEAERRRQAEEQRRLRDRPIRHYIVTGVSTRLNMRSGPGTGYSNDYDIYNGACLTPTSSQPYANRGWIRVSVSLNNGPQRQFYVSSRYLRPVRDSIPGCSRFNITR